MATLVDFPMSTAIQRAIAWQKAHPAVDGRCVVDVLSEVAFERGAQDMKWGEQNHDDGMWMKIIVEELGEAAKESLESEGWKRDEANARLRMEVMQVAAVAVAWIEAIDRRKT